MRRAELKEFLDLKVKKYNNSSFIKDDPIVIPHTFSKKEDIEIAGFFAAVLAWGQRITIINKCNELFRLMDNAPHEFIMNHKDNDLKRFEDFRHRTFNPTDTLYFIAYLRHLYKNHKSLEEAFNPGLKQPWEAAKGLTHFHEQFFNLEYAPTRTRKHIATPARGSACKRINMYLRWMVRKDSEGVDFGLWDSIKPAELICPCDLHVDRVARKLGLIKRKQTDWITAVELTNELRKLDPVDPVKYDFALFGLGIVEKY